MIAWLILIAAVLCLWHFVWEGIVAPSLRMQIRDRIFALRDELRNRIIDGDPASADRAFDYLQEIMNTSIVYLSAADPVSLYMAKRAFARDENFRLESEKRLQVIEANDVARDISKRLNRLYGDAFLVNSGGWFIYLIPLLLTLVLFSTIIDFFRQILALPTSRIQQAMPSPPTLNSAT